MPDPDLPPIAPLPSSWSAEESEVARAGERGSRLVWIVGVIAAILVVIGVLAAINRGGDKGETVWPEAVGGRPAGLGEVNVKAPDVIVDAAPGVYVWSDFDGWHLWVVNGEGVAGVSGTVTADHDGGSAALAMPDAGTVSVDGKVTTFDLPAEPKLVGIDLNQDFFTERLEIDLEGPDGPIDPTLVTSGRDTPTKELPLVIEKVPAPKKAAS